MGMPTTTPAAIRAALETQILAITPGFAKYQSIPWSIIEGEDPAGSDIRTFRLLSDPAVIDPAGIYGGGGVEKMFELRVRVSYGGLADNDLTDLIASDLSDIWTAFHPSPGGLAASVPGLISFQGFIEPEPVEGDYEDSTNLVIDFVTEVHFKAAL